jgi:sortase A
MIPAIEVDAPVVEGDTWEDLKKGVGHRIGTALPGETGNMVVSAHNDTYGEIFRDLLDLGAGDEVLVYTDEGAYRYIVNRVDIVLPTQVEVMAPTDYAALTMITCYPYLLDTHRIVVVADLAE